MTRKLAVVLVVLAFAAMTVAFPFSLKDMFNPAATQNGCMTCTMGVAIVEQLAQIHNESVDAAMERFCSYLPDDLQPPCRTLIVTFGPSVIRLLEEEETADRVCLALKMCVLPQCHLFPPPHSASYRSIDELRAALAAEDLLPRSPPEETPWAWILKELDLVFTYHKPIYDLDGDLFGDENYGELRGAFWRGGDCHDGNAAIYPGRRDNATMPASVDYNCNGIYGTNAEGVPYEDLLCAGTNPMGIALLSDSVGAHFWVATQFLDPAQYSKYAFANLIDIALNEADFPHMSASTGFTNSSWSGAPGITTSSLYLARRARNQCVHRDFQNIAVNGARSSAMASDIVFSFARNQTLDQPLVVSLSLSGNDVCNGHPGTSAMTTPAEFRTNIMSILTTLDGMLPAGSHVTFTGLIDGRVIWDNMNSQLWPMGYLNGDVRFSDWWTFLDCLQMSPCGGWMTTNETLRNVTSAWAASLNAVYLDIIAEESFQHFDMLYFANPFAEVIETWVAGGGNVTDLFCKLFAMHPSGPAQSLIADFFNNLIETEYPQLLPGVNPNNALITELFGDQGGYFGNDGAPEPKRLV